MTRPNEPNTRPIPTLNQGSALISHTWTQSSSQQSLSGTGWQLVVHTVQCNKKNLLASNQLADAFNLDAVNEWGTARVTTLLSKHFAIVLTGLHRPNLSDPMRDGFFP